MAFHLGFFFIGFAFGHVIRKSLSRVDSCPADMHNSMLVKQIKSNIKFSDKDTLNRLHELNIYHIDTLLNIYLGEKFGSKNEKSSGYIIVQKLTYANFLNIFDRLVLYASKSYYTTCVHPPSYWIGRKILCNKNDLMREPGKNPKKLIDFVTKKMKITLDSDKKDLLPYNLHEGNLTYYLEKKPEDSSLTIKFENDKANFVFISRHVQKELNLAVLNIESQEYICTADPKECKDYEIYFKRVIDLKKKKKLKVKRVFLMNLYDNVDVWRDDNPIFVKKFFKDYNEHISTRIYSLVNPDIKEQFFGDLVIIDEKVALIHQVNKLDPEGYGSGQLYIIVGNLIDEYLKLFTDPLMETGED